MRLSIIIPVLDEARRLPALLADLRARIGIHEILVVDGGSTDGTAALATHHAPRGRARQSNAGAAAATGDTLLFLHADVSLPLDAISHIERTLADPAVVAGAFRTWTTLDGSPAPGHERPAHTRSHLLPTVVHLADLRSRYSHLPYGDQALFVRAAAFHAVGGYPDQPLMEDVELARRLSRAGRIVTVPRSVRVSGRRFEARPLFYFVLMNTFPLLYRLGVSPARLARIYRDVR